MDIIIITTIKLIMDDFLEPILSIIIPGNKPKRVPGATIFYLLHDKNTPLPAK